MHRFLSGRLPVGLQAALEQKIQWLGRVTGWTLDDYTAANSHDILEPSDGPVPRLEDPISYRPCLELITACVTRQSPMSTFQIRAIGIMMMLVGALTVLTFSTPAGASGRLWSLLSAPSHSLIAGDSLSLTRTRQMPVESNHMLHEMVGAATAPRAGPSAGQRASQSAGPSSGLPDSDSVVARSPGQSPGPSPQPSDSSSPPASGASFWPNVSAEVLRDYEQRLRTSQVNPLDPPLPYSHACANYTIAYPQPGSLNGEWARSCGGASL